MKKIILTGLMLLVACTFVVGSAMAEAAKTDEAANCPVCPASTPAPAADSAATAVTPAPAPETTAVTPAPEVK